MRSGMTMIELIFAIVVIAISIVSIPSMMSIASQATKGITVDDDVLKRMAGEMVKVFQTRWDGNYVLAEGNGPLLITTTNDLNCSPRAGSTLSYRLNPDSMVQCNEINASPSAIPPTGSGNLQNGIEQINNFPYDLVINAGGGELYRVPITYQVSYVDSTVSPSDSSSNTVNATWRLGSSSDMNPNPSGATHLKRVVARCAGNAPDVDISLTFFKSNKGN